MHLFRCVLPSALDLSLCMAWKRLWSGKSKMKPVLHILLFFLVSLRVSGKWPSYLSSRMFYSVLQTPFLSLVPFSLLPACEYIIRLEICRWNRCWPGLPVTCLVTERKSDRDAVRFHIPQSWILPQRKESLCSVGQYQWSTANFYLFQKWSCRSACVLNITDSSSLINNQNHIFQCHHHSELPSAEQNKLDPLFWDFLDSVAEKSHCYEGAFCAHTHVFQVFRYSEFLLCRSIKDQGLVGQEAEERAHCQEVITPCHSLWEAGGG